MKKEDLALPTFITVPRAAELCGVSRNTMFQWVRQGRLKAYQTPGRTNLIRPADLVAFMRENGMYVLPDLAGLADKDVEMEAQHTASEAPGEAPKTMVVDDEATIRSVVTRALKDVCPVYQAATGYEALHLLTLHADIRVVLLDLRMPGQHGIQTLKEIRTFRPDVQVAIVTGYDGEIPPEVYSYSPPVRIVKKPFNVEDLRTLVQTMRAEVLSAS